jgi:hypothetical protein
MCVGGDSTAGGDTIYVDGDTCVVGDIEYCSIHILITRANANVWILLLLFAVFMHGIKSYIHETNRASTAYRSLNAILAQLKNCHLVLILWLSSKIYQPHPTTPAHLLVET